MTKKNSTKYEGYWFYGSDYNISDMTIDKFHSLIDQEQIKIVNDSSVTKQIKSEVISAKKQNMAIDFIAPV